MELVNNIIPINKAISDNLETLIKSYCGVYSNPNQTYSAYSSPCQIQEPPGRRALNSCREKSKLEDRYQVAGPSSQPVAAGYAVTSKGTLCSRRRSLNYTTKNAPASCICLDTVTHWYVCICSLICIEGDLAFTLKQIHCHSIILTFQSQKTHGSIICLMTCIGANQSTNQNPVCWGKVLCMTHPTTRLSDFSRFLYNCAKGRLQSWHWRGNYCVILGSTGSLTCLLYMTHWEWEPSVPSHERQPLARSSYFNVSPCFPTPMKTCFKSECWLSYLSKSSYFTVDSRSYLVKDFFLVGTQPEVDISLRINRLLLCNGSWEWSRCNESNGKCWFISVN